MSQQTRQITSLGKANQATLRKQFGFKTINEAIKSLAKDLLGMDEYNQKFKSRRKFSENDKKLTYQILQDQYNMTAELNLQEKKTQKKAEIKQKRQERRRKKAEEKLQTFTLDLTLRIVYKKKKKVYTANITEGPFTSKISNAGNIAWSFNEEDSIKIIEVVSYTINILNTATLKKNNKPKTKQMMKNCIVLKNNWVKHAKSIASYAYDETDDICVYYQLSKYLLNPVAGRPTKFIGGEKITPESIYNFIAKHFNTDLDSDDDYSNLKMNDGVNVEMMNVICKELKRNIYAYDEDDKCFYKNMSYNTDNHYSPIVFYKLYGHMYLLNTTEALKSIVESNKKTAKLIKTSTIKETTTNINLPVFQMEYFMVDNAMDLESGIYLLQKSNILQETLAYISHYYDMPIIKNSENVIVQMCYNNVNDEPVYIACDVNYSQNINYDQLKSVATEAGIHYVNEGVGSVIMKILFPEPIKEQEEKDEDEEDEDEEIIENENETLSYFNNVVSDEIINTPAFKSYQFVEKLDVTESIENLNIYRVDKIKCRRNILNWSKYNWAVYSVMDIPTQFNGIVKCGSFYVITDNVFPFRGSGWYCEPLVQYGLDNNLITLDNIKLEFLPSKTLPHNYFQENIKKLLDAFECEPDLQKLSINAYIGLMGKNKSKYSKSKFTLDENEAGNWWVENNNKFINCHSLDNGKSLYEGIEKGEILWEATSYPIYSQILQMEALELHKLETLIKNENGIILDRNTDAIRYASNEPFSIDTYYWTEGVKKYQDEKNDELKYEKLARMNRQHVLDYSKFILEWNNTYDYEGSAEEKAKEIIDSNISTAINGCAGTGKSYLTNKIIEELQKQEIEFLAFSPTNKGARIIGGNTIHSLYYKFKHNKYAFIHSLKDTKYIFIDEVSMMIVKFYQLFIMIKKIYPSMKFIIAGDFAQLPPVLDSWSGDYKNSPALFELCDGNRLELTKCRRSDDKLFKLCKNTSSVNVKDFKQTDLTYLNVAYTHETRIRINKVCMDNYILENKKSYITIEKNSKNEKTQDVKLCVGMPVIAHTTNKKLNILNSERFTITKINSKQITVTEKDRVIAIDTNSFHKFFYVGFCITIHASQGETFTEKYTIYDWRFKHFSKEAKYVALSRATNINNIQIA